MSERILVVDDHASMAESVADGLVDLGYEAVPVTSGAEAEKLLEAERFDAVVTDLRMPGSTGLDLLAASRKLDPARPVIVMTAFSAVDSAVESIRQGAYHYMTKPFKVAELALFLGRALEEARLRRETLSLRRALGSGLPEIVGRSAGMAQVCDLVLRVADTHVPVLILGETGTGKGVVARALHTAGTRKSGSFVAVNCAALPETLLESELFGHVKGAFTGATQNRIGLLEEADGGTLFLDEIAEMAPALQAKLLHVIESGTVRAVGSNRERKVDVRFLAATHRDLRARVADGSFREDLLYRLDVVAIEIPPLRRRREDIPDLVAYFLARAKERHRIQRDVRFSADAMAKLLDSSFPGNVRELEHLVERAVILARGEVIEASELPASVASSKSEPAFGDEVLPLREIQRRYAQWAYERLGGKKLHTAETLGVDFKTLSKLLDQDEPNSKR